MEISPDLFRQVAGCFATGVTVVTTQDREGIPYGPHRQFVHVRFPGSPSGPDLPGQRSHRTGHLPGERPLRREHTNQGPAGHFEPFCQPGNRPVPRALCAGPDRRSRGDGLHGLVRVRDRPPVRRGRSRHPGGGSPGRPRWGLRCGTAPLLPGPLSGHGLGRGLKFPARLPDEDVFQGRFAQRDRLDLTRELFHQVPDQLVSAALLHPDRSIHHRGGARKSPLNSRLQPIGGRGNARRSRLRRSGP